jgi:hypothetical protein
MMKSITYNAERQRMEERVFFEYGDVKVTNAVSSMADKLTQ